MNRYRIVSLICLLVFSIWTTSAAAGETQTAQACEYENHALMRLGPLTPDQYPEFLRLGFDVVETRPDGIIMIIATAKEQALLISRYGASVEIPNLEEFFRSRLNPDKLMGGYHTYSESNAEMIAMCEQYPDFTHLDTIGYSLEGRPMIAMKISDNADVDEDEVEVFFNGMIHGPEVMGMEICLATMHYLLDNKDFPWVAPYVNDAETWYVPIINVDGYVYNEITNPQGGGVWRKNRRDNGDGSIGVDLNRNWGFRWGADSYSSPDPSSANYRGTGPFSEPETQVLRQFIASHDFAGILNFHSYGDQYMPPFGVPYICFCPDIRHYGPLLNALSMITGYFWGYGYGPGNGGEATCWMYAEQRERHKSFSVLVETGAIFWEPEENKQAICNLNVGQNLEFIDQIRELWQRPTWYMATSFTHIDTILNPCAADFSRTAVFRNTSAEPMQIRTSFVDSSGWVNPWFTMPACSTTIPAGDSVMISLNVSPTALGAVGRYSGCLLVALNQGDPLIEDTLTFVAIVRIGGPDPDFDGFVTECDNCPLVANPGQEDGDGDGVGDVCDNCPADPNPDQLDTNYNGIGDACDFTCGDANGDGTINVGDAVHIINYVFKGGPAPDPEVSGDANCDGTINVGDAVHIINYVFKGGPEPGCP